MLDFFKGFGEILSGIIDFVIGLVEDLVYTVQLVGSVVARIPSYFSWIPAPVLAIIISIFAVVVIYKIIGREG